MSNGRVTSDRWTPVTEQLPPLNRHVLVCNDKGLRFVGHCVLIRGTPLPNWEHLGGWCTIKNTQWQPLPDKPEECR